LKFEGENNMENAYICNGMFLDSRTIRLLEEYPVSMKRIKLIIIPEKTSKPERKAGLMKGKIKMAEDFDEPLEDMREYME
jgi:hypothetical protein